MKTTLYPQIEWQPETLSAIAKLSTTSPGTLAEQSAQAGVRLAEPYLVLIDQLIRIAKAYRVEFGQLIGEDYVARPEFAGMLSGVRGMLNFDGAALWEGNHNSDTRRSRDTKDNGMIESLYWTCCEIAGIDGESI